MRYWLLTTEYPPFYGGGIGTYCSITAQMLQSHQHDVTVFLPDFSVSGVQESVEESITVVRFCPRQTNAHHFLGYTAYLSYEFAEIVRKYITQKGQPDIIEAHEYQGIAYFLQQFKLQLIEPFAGLKIIITCHSPSFICLDYNQVPVYQFPDYWTGEMEKACIVAADLIIFPSAYVKNEIENRLKIDDVSWAIVPNPIPAFDKGSVSDEVKLDKNLVVCFGKMAPLKGTFELLKYFDQLWRNGSPLKLCIVGGTEYFFYPEGRTMHDIVHTKYNKYFESGQLILTGNLPAHKVSVTLSQAQLVVVPSLFDNFPYTVLEAMSAGKLVFASRQGGQVEIIKDGSTGFLFDHHKEGDFFKQMDQIMNLGEEEVKKIADAGRKHIVADYSPQVIYDLKIKALEALNYTSGLTVSYPFINKIKSEDVVSLNNDFTKSVPELLSIVIPYYNMGKYLPDTLASAFASDYANKEVIIVNDGTTDPESVAVLEDMQSKYCLKVVSTENKGLSATRNLGATIATGEFIAFLDADDTVHKSYYSKAINILKQYKNVHFVGCWLNYFGEAYGTWPTFNPEPPYILIHNTINSSAVVYKRDTFVHFGLNCIDMIYGMEDWESVIKLTSLGFRGVVIPEKLFNYRVRKGSMSRSFTREKQLYLQKLIAQKHKAFYNQYGAEISQLLNSNGSSLYFDNPTFEVVQMIPSKQMASLKNALKERIKRNPALRKTAYFIYKSIKRIS